MELKDDPRFAENGVRFQNREELAVILNNILADWTTEQAKDMLIKQGIAFGVINTIDQLVKDPQIQARKMIIPVKAWNGDTFRTSGSPIKLSECPPREENYAPGAGEHNHEVFQDILGMSEEEINQLF